MKNIFRGLLLCYLIIYDFNQDLSLRFDFVQKIYKPMITIFWNPVDKLDHKTYFTGPLTNLCPVLYFGFDNNLIQI